MGCDIHGWIEACVHPEYYDDPHTDDFAWSSIMRLDRITPRNYRVFGRLAHDGSRQRADEVALFSGRGIPDNVADKTGDDYLDWKADAHHESWFLHSELFGNEVKISVEDEGTSVEEYFPIEYVRDGVKETWCEGEEECAICLADEARWEACFSSSKKYAEAFGPENVRWVIWFDN